jgi:hypothetical protein
MSLDYRHNAFNAGATLNHLSERYSSVTLAFPIRAYEMLNLRGGYDFGDNGPLKGTQVSLNVENTLDKPPPVQLDVVGGHTGALNMVESRRANTTLHFYRDSQGREVDFLRAAGGHIDLSEAKWTAAPDDRWQRVLGQIAATLSASKTHDIGEQSIVCRVAAPRRENEVVITNPRAATLEPR